MVKNLFKYEFTAHARVALPVFLLLLATACFSRITQIFENDGIIYSIISIFSYSSFALVCVVAMLTPLVFGVVRFYKHLFSSEGYLTLTLPITSVQHIFVKLFTYLAFQCSALVLLIVCVGIVFRFEFIYELCNAAAYLINMLPNINGLHITFYIIEFILLIVLSFGSQILLYYGCICIGQTRRKNRVAFSICVYFIYSFIMQIFSSVVSVLSTVIFANISEEAIEAFFEEHLLSVIHLALGGSAIIYLIFSVICFLIVRYVLNRKVNLE